MFLKTLILGKKMIKKIALFCSCIILVILPKKINSWGFKAHKDINNAAVFTLHGNIFSFYKKHLNLITEFAVNADKRRYTLSEEGCRHYLDADYYESSLPIDTIPHRWNDAVKKYSKDTLMKYGILPWYLQLFKANLTKAFEQKDAYKIIRLSADIGHYASDLHVPLHSTQNYNGQLSGQQGIHGLFESRMYELFCNKYNFMTGKAKYINNLNNEIWQRFSQSFAAVDSVFKFEKIASENIKNKYVLKTKGNKNEKVYNEEYCNYYNNLLNGMIERRIRASVEFTGSLWYTCWVDAGQPDLKNLKTDGKKESKKENKSFFDKLFNKGSILGRSDD